VGYIEKPINSESNMMALVAEDATFTSPLHLHALLLTLGNSVIQEFLGNVHSGNILHYNSIAGTSLKDLKQWDSWHCSTVAQAWAQVVSDVLNLSFKPATGEKDPFEAKQKYMYAVFESVPDGQSKGKP